MKCPVCGEWTSDHRLLGEIINPHAWHGVFTGMGRSLKPSDGEPYELLPKDVYYVSIPHQRTIIDEIRSLGRAGRV